MTTLNRPQARPVVEVDDLVRERWLDEVDLGIFDRAYDEPEPDMLCGECGTEWCGHWTRATRLDPPEPRRPDCPGCGS
jgi:hypothetical protein